MSMGINRILDFTTPGVRILVDGQFGSTGKGLLAAYIAEQFYAKINVYTTNAGPNSGHTAYFRGQKIVTRQLPMGYIVSRKVGVGNNMCYMNPGAIIDPEILEQEINDYLTKGDRVHVSKWAPVILDGDKNPVPSLSRVASTQKGTTQAEIRKIMRVNNPDWANHPNVWITSQISLDFNQQVVMYETAQGYSLGINAGFYPYCTHRDCTIMKALSDLNCHPRHLRDVFMTVRTLPIRVGNTSDGTSGPCYPDQRELTWEEVGVTPEITTVTGRERRIFTWSNIQFEESFKANWPSVIFLNFCQYVSHENLKEIMGNMRFTVQKLNGGQRGPLILTGWGPKSEDIRVEGWL